MKKARLLFRLTLLLLLLGAVAVYFCNRAVRKAAEGKLYSDENDVPYNRAGLLLGTAKYLADGRLNYYYQYRIDAAEKLYKAGKIKYIIASGDNSRPDYNEPETMRKDLISRGVDSTRIHLDYAGLRTFDSMVRLREIFGQTSVTVISQPFHNERALYIAQREGIAAVGFNAKDLSGGAGARVQAREKMARVKVFVDYLFGARPKFLGKKIHLS